MKRILSILIAGALAISMCAALTGCGRDRSKNTSSSVTSTIKATTPTKPVSTTAPTDTGNEYQSTTIAVNPNDLSSIKPKVNYKNEEGAYLEKAALEEADLAEATSTPSVATSTLPSRHKPLVCAVSVERKRAVVSMPTLTMTPTRTRTTATMITTAATTTITITMTMTTAAITTAATTAAATTITTTSKAMTRIDRTR